MSPRADRRLNGACGGRGFRCDQVCTEHLAQCHQLAQRRRRTRRQDVHLYSRFARSACVLELLAALDTDDHGSRTSYLVYSPRNRPGPRRWNVSNPGPLWGHPQEGPGPREARSQLRPTQEINAARQRAFRYVPRELRGVFLSILLRRKRDVARRQNDRAPRHGPSLPLRRGLWHKLGARSRYEHGVPLFRGVRPHDAWRLPRGDAPHA